MFSIRTENDQDAQQITYRHYKIICCEDMVNETTSFDWSLLYDSTTADTQLRALNGCLSTLFENHVKKFNTY